MKRWSYLKKISKSGTIKGSSLLMELLMLGDKLQRLSVVILGMD